MKKFFTFALLTFFIFLSQIRAYSSVITVREGVQIPLKVEHIKTSKNTVAGEKINAKVAYDVKVKDVIVFKEGDPAIVNVSDIKKTGFLGNPGEMMLIGGKVKDANGDEHNIELNRKIVGEEKTYPKVLLGASIFFLFPLALFAFVEGGDAKLNANTPVDVSLRESFFFTPNL